MARRIRIPPLLDAAVVTDPSEMAWLNDDAAITRRLSGTGGWLHRVLWRRMYRTLAVDATRILPAFDARDNAARAEQQAETERRLTALAGSSASPFDRDAVVTLGRYVSGEDPDQMVGVTAQQIVGRLFYPSYAASRESYVAAKDVAAVLSACPVNALRVRWWKWSGRLARSRALIWDLAGNEPQVIHATAIALHTLVDALARMRKAFRADGWHVAPAQAAARALVAPRALLRECVMKGAAGSPAQALRPGTLVVFRAKTMHTGTADNDLAFSSRQWSQCPAHAIVPRLLEDVWRAAVTERAYRRYPARRPSLVHRLVGVPFIWAFTRLNRRVPWYGLPKWPAFLNLLALRSVLRRTNLHDTTLLAAGPATERPVPGPDVHRWRTADGSFNDLQDPSMGRAGTRFGRNVPLAYTTPDHAAALLDPNPRLVSRRLLARRKFVPATSLNVLAAAWIQFQVHDWFGHGPSDHEAAPVLIPIDDDDPWPGPRPMPIFPTRRDAAGPGEPPTFINTVTHWWDASQLYGSDQPTQSRVRTRAGDGKLKLEEGGRLLPCHPDTQLEITGVNDNWWIGLSLLHHIFTYEHNAICDRLRIEYPTWDDEQLFQTARLITAALLTKIHDVEWVPVVLDNPPVQKGLYASWWGLAGKWITTNIGRLPNAELISGIPGSPTDHHGAPYAITEEFVSVYRMHAFMMPDELSIYSAGDGARRTSLTFDELLGPGARAAITTWGMDDLLYSLGRNLPGALTLGNYPKTLRQLAVGPYQVLDLATLDIFRDRERGVPRYNQFRELLHLPRIRSFTELNPTWAVELEKVYGTVDRIDLMVGLFAETPPPGFGFSDTTFRIFLLMNGRRLKSDRFFTVDYRAAIYTQAGIDWINTNDMRSILIRHFPGLRGTIERVPNVFKPWAA